MGLLDGLFDPSIYSGQGGLLARLQPMLGQIPQSAGFPQQPEQNPIAVGGYQMPRMGNPDQFQPQQVNIPPNAQPTQGQVPPQPQPSGFFDRLNSGLQSIGNGGSVIGALTGNHTDPVAANRRNQTQLFEAYKQAGLSPAQAYIAALQPQLAEKMLGGGSTNDIKEYQYAKDRDGFKGSFQDWIANKRAGAGEYGLQAIWGVGKDGKPALVQLGKGGEAIQSKLPEGFQPSQKPIEIDAGTHTILMDPQTRQPIANVPKNIEGKEAAEKVGQARGTAKVALPAAETTTNRAVRMLDELEKHPGFSDGVGFIVGRLPALTPKAADFRERVEQIDAMVFGEAVEVMRGLGALTDREGPKVSAARARLKTAKSEADFRTALKDIREVFRDGIENMRKKAGSASTEPANQSSPAVVDYRTYFGSK